MDTTFDPSDRREVQASHRADESFDSSDQFFQAYKAGYLHRPSVLSDREIWSLYIDWLYEEGVTT